MSEKLALIFSINDTFENSKEEFEEYTGNKVSIPTLKKHVEKIGTGLSEEIKKRAKLADMFKLSANIISNAKKDIIYVGMDGTGVPMRTGGTKEAKVAIIFKELDRWQFERKRNYIVKRRYVATLEDVEGFIPLVWSSYLEVAKDEDYKVVCLGDGAPWIWKRFQEMFPDRLEILDFYHLCEYIWSLAKIYYSAEKTQAEQWAEEQLERLKNSESNLVFEELKFIEKIGGTKELLEETEKVLSYLESNKDRIDYKSYLSQGLMIGSGVIESSNKVVVTNVSFRQDSSTLKF